jgi:sodium transport system permease protein
MNALDRIKNVFIKEVLDNLRDRRSLSSGLLSSLIGPAILLALIVIIGKSVFKDQIETRLKLPVSGAERAPVLIQFLEQNGVDIVPAPDDPESEVRNGNAEVVLIIPEGYGDQFSAGEPATLRLVIDSSRQSAIASVERATRILESYSRQIGSLRLIARGVNPSIAQALSIERQDMATPQTQALIFLNMMPYFIVLVVFLGGMYVIIDTTAGERERGSLEPLLINPVARWEFVVGKLAASLPFAIFTLILTLLAFALAFNVVPLEEYVGIQLSINPAALVGIFLIALPMILLASSLQMIIATYTRSFKEAQTYVSFLPLIPALPGIGLAFLPVKAKLWTMLIPTFGQQLLINQMMRAEPVSALNIVVSTIVTVGTALALIFVAIKLYERERVLFGTK